MTFSSGELYGVRNFIPINKVIKALNIEHRVTEGCFRFQCPVCFGFHTATKAETNLARCFNCQKNFNTIDLAMICGRQSFVDAVRYLKKLKYE